MTKYTMKVLPILAALLFGALLTTPASADEMSDLKESFRARYPKLQALISAGKVGKTYLGSVESVNGAALDADAAKVVADENADRAKLYVIIAKQQNTTPALVAERNATREFASAASGEWLKHKDGWKQK